MWSRVGLVKKPAINFFVSNYMENVDKNKLVSFNWKNSKIEKDAKANYALRSAKKDALICSQNMQTNTKNAKFSKKKSAFIEFR